MNTKFYLLTLLMVFILIGCSERQNQKLSEINDYLNQHPTQPLDVRPAFDSIDYKSLSERDQVFHDLLSIKISDLNFENHNSDSLINKILAYTEKHPDVSYLCEAQYYGGRIHAEIGDYPTALQYYQQALDNVTTTSDSAIMLGKIYAQMGGLLDRLRLYDEAIPLFENVIEQDIIRGDSINEVNDMLYLGQIYLRKGNPEKAKLFFSKVLKEKTYLSTQTRAKCKMLLAGAYRSLENDSALSLIRESLDSIDAYTRWNALAYASWIYKKFGSLDTAYMYANELIHGESRNFKESGYRIVLSDKFQNYTPVDSLRKYIEEYNAILDRDYDLNQRNLTLMQQSMYNYNLHELARRDAEEKNHTLFTWIYIVVISFLVSVLLLTLRLLHNRKTIIRLQTSLANVRKVQSSLDIAPAESPKEETGQIVLAKVTVQSLREEMSEELRRIAEKKETVELAPVIATSAVYNEIKDYIRNEKAIENNTELWEELEATVLKASPEFRNHLTLLTNGSITENEYKTALLIKCNIGPTHIATLLSKTVNAIVSRRTSISKKIYGKNLGPSFIDCLIRNL